MALCWHCCHQPVSGNGSAGFPLALLSVITLTGSPVVVAFCLLPFVVVVATGGSASFEMYQVRTACAQVQQPTCLTAHADLHHRTTQPFTRVP
jgi:hypothetical protein